MRLAAILAALALSGCSLTTVQQAQSEGHPSPSPRQVAAGDPPPACVTLMVRAMTSPDKPVAGAWACQTAEMQARAAKAGIADDKGLQGVAGVFGMTAPVLVGPMVDGGWEYRVMEPSGQDSTKAVVGHLFVWPDAAGKVFALGFA